MSIKAKKNEHHTPLLPTSKQKNPEISESQSQSQSKFKLEKCLEGMEIVRKLSWYVPVFMYNLFTFEFIQYLFEEIHKCVYKKQKTGEEEEQSKLEKSKQKLSKLEKSKQKLSKLEKSGYALKIAIQVVFLLFLAFEVLLQFILFITDSVNLNKRCCNDSTSGGDTFEEVMFVTDFINSLVALGCCYFIYVNSDILEGVNFKNIYVNSKILEEVEESKLENEKTWKCPFPSGKNKFFSRTGLFLAYIIIFILPFILIFYFKPEYNPSYRELNYKYYLGTVNTFIDVFPDILENSGCNVTKSMNLKTLRYVDSILECIITVQWHLSPVLACVAIRYICKHLQNEIEQAVNRSKKYIEGKWKGMLENEIQEVREESEKTENPIQEFYKVAKQVRKYSNRLYYVSSLNIFSIIIIISDLFVSYLNDSEEEFGEKFFSFAKKSRDVNEIIVFRIVFVYIYQFIGVWLMSDGILGVNMQLAKYSDEIKLDDEIRNNIFGENTGRLEKFSEGIKQEISMIAESNERFEIAFFGDFSTSLFYTIIPIGMTVMVSFVVRAIHATRFFNC